MNNSILSIEEASPNANTVRLRNLVERFTGLTRRDNSSTVPSPSRNPSLPVGVFERSYRNSDREKSGVVRRLSIDPGPKWHDMSRGLYPWVSNMGRAVGISK